jgi:DNA-binding NtrC family response regulator
MQLLSQTRPSPAPSDVATFRRFRSAEYQRVYSRLERFAACDAAVLLEGEIGTGKTLLARELHALSRRADGPFHQVVLPALDDALASSHLFGHLAGAYTGARENRAGAFVSANRGSLFLDEIGKASRAVQQMLLHVIEYGTFQQVGADRLLAVDIRVIAATNVPLETLVAQDVFLPDLHARLMLFRVRLPALREMRDDIPAIVQSYLEEHARRCGYDIVPRVDRDLLLALTRAPWPYNLRQLWGTIMRLVIEARGSDTITLDHCGDDLGYLRDVARQEEPLTPERIEEALGQAGTVSGAARLLGVDRTTLQRRRRRLRGREGDDTRSA